jgi:hypothetical protein
MSVAAVYCLHYGAEWLEWSLRSVADFADQIYVLYTRWPSHGHLTSLPCPETRDDLIDVVNKFNVIWYDVGPFQWEGQHRDLSISIANDGGFDQALVVDADEIWDASHLADFIAFSRASNSKIVRVAMHHFWRSTNWYCRDDASPIRLFNLKKFGGEVYYPLDGQRVFHMGYAQSPKLIEYKMSIHGHKNELRPDWYNNKFLSWHPGDTDVHPSGIGTWNPVQWKDDGTLQVLIGDHPYWGKDIIT